jgi:hypothetical protein
MMARLFAQVRKSGPNGMNRTESAYADNLENLRQAGQVASWKFEAVKLKLAGSTFYSPDFLVILPCGKVELHEVKGYWMDDARVKIKVAAENFPWFIFKAIKRDGRGWDTEEFRP